MRVFWCAVAFSLLLFACQEKTWEGNFGPQCQSFLQEAEKTCTKTISTEYPLLCEGAEVGRKRLLDLGPGDYEEGCRAARKSLERALKTALEERED